MRKALIVGVTALMVSGAAMYSVAADPETKADPGTKQVEQAGRFVGEIVTVDLEARTFVVKEKVKSGEAKEITFALGENARVMLRDKPGQLKDLKSGVQVTVKFSKKGSKHVAEMCVVMQAA